MSSIIQGDVVFQIFFQKFFENLKKFSKVFQIFFFLSEDIGSFQPRVIIPSKETRCRIQGKRGANERRMVGV
jgi:hypothetical protein